MRKSSFPRNRLRWLAVSGTAVTLLLVASSVAPAFAGDDDQAIDTKILRGILEGIGLQRDGGKTIDYRERSPLVIPSNTAQLPPPEQADHVSATNPNWPKDPDVLRAREAKKLEDGGTSSDQREREQNPLSPAELTPGPKPRRSVNTAGTPGPDVGPAGVANPLSPSELGYKGSLLGDMFGRKDDQTAARFTGEPARTSLTEPPPGYQTPSPVEPYGPSRGAAPKATDYYGTHGELTH
jgi:hypothetical protein